jgi:DNA-binding NarL/FixJ family response regulator
MDVMVVATDSLRALALEATLDLGGHRVVALVDSATAALDHARTSRPSLAIVQLGSRNWADMVSELRDRLSVPSLLVGADCDWAASHRAAAMGLVREPCGSRLILRAVKVAAELCEGRRPRGRLPRQLEGFGRPPRQARPSRKQPARAPSQQRDGSG